ncbi:hypothetical protein CR513_13274, partial [Mucuna pruriens]
MEMSNFTAKLKSLKLELGEDLIVHLVLISLPTNFGQFKVDYNTQKDKWSLNEFISYCVQEEERLQRDKIDSAHFASTSQNKKRKNIKAMLNALGAISFMIPLQDLFFEMGNVRILEEVDFEKEENIRNVVFKEESINDIGQVLVLITVQETIPIIGNNQNKTMMRRSIRGRRHAILDDYIIFLQEHEDDIGLTKDDPINFCQVMQSSNSQKCIDAMKDKMKSMQDNDIWNLVKLLEGVKPIGCKWIFKTKNDSKGNIKKYKAHLVAKGFTQKKDIATKKPFLQHSDIKRSFSRYPRLSQENYVNKVLDRFDMKDSKLGDTPIAKGDKFSLKQCPKNDLERNEMQKISYASVVGSLMYLNDLGMHHWKTVKRVMPYLKRTKAYMLTYWKFEGLEIIKYSDSDFNKVDG